MNSLLLTIIFVITLGHTGGQATVLIPIANGTMLQVTGSLVTFCGSPVLYSPVSPPTSLNEATRDGRLRLPKWQTDWGTECLKSRAEMVAYCHRMFANTISHATDVILAPVVVPLQLPTTNVLRDGEGMSQKTNVLELKPYWCLIGGKSSDEHSQPDHLQPLSPPTHNLSTIFDIHRTFFLRRFDQLSKRTESDVSGLVNQVIHAVEQLTSLPAVSPQHVLLLSSSLLQSAHQQLKSVWTADEVEWSRLEAQRHSTLTAELNSEELAGEHEFAYVLQEPGAAIDRLQSALSRLLGALADSVHEEVFHLTAVLQHQPASLQLTSAVKKDTSGPNRSRPLPEYVTSLASVHGALLKWVKQATVAINILRERMRTETGKNTATPPPASHSQHYHYRPELVTSYNRLQYELTEARHVLSLAKQRLLFDVAENSQSLVDKLKATAAATAGAGNSSTVEATDPWRVLEKHSDELAYLDFMVGHVLKSYPRQTGLLGNMSADQLLTWSRIWRPESGDLVTVRPDLLPVEQHRKSFALNFVFGFLLACKAIALLLCIGLGLLLITVSVHLAREHCRAGRARRLHFLAQLQHSAKHWLAGTPLGPSSKATVSRRRFDWSTGTNENGAMAASFTGLAPSGGVHGYSNPACDNPKTVVVGSK